MPRRSILTARQRAALIDLPKDKASILHHYTLSDHDIEIIRTRRHARNRLGFALQLCAFRYPGRLLLSGELIPEAVSRFIAAQLGEEMEELSHYAETDVTRRRHLVDLRQVYDFKMFSGHRARELKAWLVPSDQCTWYYRVVRLHGPFAPFLVQNTLILRRSPVWFYRNDITCIILILGIRHIILISCCSHQPYGDNIF
jgi:hypothetical protein